MNAWEALDATVLHVVPVDDLIEHDSWGEDCVCGPEHGLVRTDNGDRWLIVHHALDGRP
jgi:hypothetical protein